MTGVASLLQMTSEVNLIGFKILTKASSNSSSYESSSKFVGKSLLDLGPHFKKATKTIKEFHLVLVSSGIQSFLPWASTTFTCRKSFFNGDWRNNLTILLTFLSKGFKSFTETSWLCHQCHLELLLVHSRNTHHQNLQAHFNHQSTYCHHPS